MRISDWSSDVCSSDLVTVAAQKYPDPPISEARILRRQRLHRRNHRGIPGDLAPLVAQARSSYREKRASPANRETALPAIRHLLPTDRHAHHFFAARSEEHTSELQSLMRISYAVFCLKKKKNKPQNIKI